MLAAGAHLFVIGAAPEAAGSALPDTVMVAGDTDGLIAQRYATDGRPLALVLDPNQRVIARLEGGAGPMAPRALAAVEAAPRVDPFPAPRHPPVLSIPRLLSPAQCKQLIDHCHGEGGVERGTYSPTDRRIDDGSKRRRDCLVRDPGLVKMLSHAMATRLFPEIARAFQAKMSRVEELKVVQYDPGPGGDFRPHRANARPTGAHRQFAITLNLNAEDYDGGRLRFPEYGGASYKPATGEALVFSCSLLHEATDVENGPRYVLLSYLYDEQGEELRQSVRRRFAEQAAGG